MPKKPEPRFQCGRCAMVFTTETDRSEHFKREHDVASMTHLSWQDRFDRTVLEIRRIYDNSIRPVEDEYRFELHRNDWFSESLKSSKPFVLFLGPFSSGKTTFINYLLGGDYLHTGPEPTTNKFRVIMWGQQPQDVSGRILASNPDLPFKGLQTFGSDFLENLSGYTCPSEVLKSVTLIDTPGVLESATDIHSRLYDYVKVCEWFADRADLIFVLFDPTKLDSGVELRGLFQTLKGKESRLRMVLNKADTVRPAMLMRVYGSLFWNLSSMIKTTEPPRVYVSSFWVRPYQYVEFAFIFDQEKADLLFDMVETVPTQALDQRISVIMKRAREVQTHAAIVGYIREKIEKTFGIGMMSELKTILREKLPKVFQDVQVRHRLVAADFPSEDQVRTFFSKLSEKELERLPKLSSFEKKSAKAAADGVSRLERLQHQIDVGLPKLLSPKDTAALADPREFLPDSRRQMLRRAQSQTLCPSGCGPVRTTCPTPGDLLRTAALSGHPRGTVSRSILSPVGVRSRPSPRPSSFPPHRGSIRRHHRRQAGRRRRTLA
eukprot:TRINITY_DN2019_c0_g1_i2.p1 TRINITY_DN2019_c0_g1~~TRINITY_DN2019_c0_g1_i2.p1  ORF type:complete len:548 (+),score=100.80 TRINITY_DN2019_c0_g1_i2:128-1771(+)